MTASRLQLLLELERRHDLFATRVDGWSAWRVLRNPLHRLGEGLPLAQPDRSNVKRSLQALVATLKLLWLLFIGGRRELIVKTCRSGLRQAQGEGFRDVYFDGLLERGHSYLKLEEINSPDFDEQAARALCPADLDPVVFTFWGRVLGQLAPIDDGTYCRRVAALLAAEAGLNVEPGWLRLRLSTVYWQARLYAALLARIQPRAVLVSDTGEYALRIACARRGVRFIELQHGVFDDRHPDAVPAWVKGGPDIVLLPDHLACRGDFWIAQLAGSRQGHGPAVAVGNELIDGARKRRRPRGAQKKLVLTTQGLDSERLADWVREMVATAPVGTDWDLAIKLHPVYDVGTRAFDCFRCDPRVTVIGGAEQPNVFDLLADADLHLSIASACHFDAAALGVPTMIVPLAGHEALLGAVDGVQIMLADTPEQAWSALASGVIDDASIYRFAVPGFVANLERLLT